MPQNESKPVDKAADEEAVKAALAEASNEAEEHAEGSGEDEAGEGEQATGETAAKKKKKSKKKKIVNALTGQGSGSLEAGSTNPQLSDAQIIRLLEQNPALRSELGSADPSKAAELLKKLSVSDMLTGMAPGGKNQKDMASHKFWATQPVPKFGEKAEKQQDGPLREDDVDKVDKNPAPLPQGFEWVTMDLTDAKELEEVYDLLSNHYVEDEEAMFRFNYPYSFLNWALKAPGWRKEWHAGVRAATSGKLVAFISAIPVDLRVRSNVIKGSEVNFMVVHKKLRSKRLAPVLIREITRRINLDGIFQAIYTAGVLLPTPISTCRYFHRSLNWEKLYDVGFSPLPPNSTRQRQISKYKLPDKTSTKGLRPAKKEDLPAIQKLLTKYLDRVNLAQQFNAEEVEHWLFNQEAKPEDQVIWTYVVEDPESKEITDFFSFYRLPSTVIGNKKYPTVDAAYQFYYGTDAAWKDDGKNLKVRLNELMHDCLILAKNAKFDVFNALTLLDNPLFLEQQKFGAGDGQLHYYLFNWRTAPIPGGVDPKNHVDDRYMGGVGVIML